MSDSHLPALSERHAEALERFVLFWGEMASDWGINRTMAQIHALLYAWGEPLDTDAIMAHLRVSRGNANMNLRSLLSWNLIRKVHLPGSRKDYYAAEQDAWEMTARIAEERERRELRPVLAQLQTCDDVLNSGAEPLSEVEQAFAQRLEAFQELMSLFEQFMRVLMPLVRRENLPMIRQMLALMESSAVRTAETDPSR
jgi:DNA-binding transcriptional regulator GbsR (MarR family)